MRNAYALLGVAFIIVFGAAYLLVSRVHAPVELPNNLSNNSKSMTFTLSSPVFENNGPIPPEYTCDGDNIPPPLEIQDVPEDTVSMVLVMDDPDIPNEVKQRMGIDSFDHWALYEIAPDVRNISADDLVGTAALNTSGETAYTGPCPPTQYEPTTHRYVFRLYALSGHLNFITTPTLNELETAAKEMAIGEATLIGTYSRVTNQNQ